MGSLKKAVLLSGGVDSICLTYGIRPEIAYTVDYGQRAAKREIFVSALVCSILSIDHKVISVDCGGLGSGILIDKESLDISPSQEWWPFRNQLLITLAAMQATKDGVNQIHLASVKTDSFHKDGTHEFYELVSKLLEFQEGNIKVCCETLGFFSHELIAKYNVPLNILSLAHSCHVSNQSCGKCPGCMKQLRVKAEIGMD